jgi:UDP-glucose 4-epimerase
MRILVTGGTGYIGSTAVEILLKQGFEISILDDCSMGHADTVPAGVRFVEGSLLDRAQVADALTGCNAVMHFAGKSLVGESVEKPDLYHSVNVDGTRILLDEMRKQAITKIVFSSSAATYGEPKTVPILETAETNPDKPLWCDKVSYRPHDYRRGSQAWNICSITSLLQCGRCS